MGGKRYISMRKVVTAPLNIVVAMKSPVIVQPEVLPYLSATMACHS